VSAPAPTIHRWLNGSWFKRAFHRLLFQDRLVARAFGLRMPPLDPSAPFGTHYADLTTLLLYRTLVRLIPRDAVRTAHEVGVGMFGTLSIVVSRRFPTLRLTTSTISADEVRSATATARANGVELDCIQSDVLERVAGPVDLVWWNLPYYDADVLDLVDRLLAQAHERGVVGCGGSIVLGFNTVPLPVADVEAVAARHPSFRVVDVQRFWYNPHCVLTLTHG
jgi:hypothetical protein